MIRLKMFYTKKINIFFEHKYDDKLCYIIQYLKKLKFIDYGLRALLRFPLRAVKAHDKVHVFSLERFLSSQLIPQG